MNRYSKLLSPVQIGSITVKNRIVMAPMGTNYLNPDGSVTKRYIAYLSARAKGGAGLIILESAYVQPSGKLSSRELGIHCDETIEGMTALVMELHRYGAKVCLQLGHAGRQTQTTFTGEPLLAPSAIACPLCGGVPREMELSDINETIEAFGRAARRAQSAGCDAVEIHGAHGYLLNEFLSAYSNKRTDQYGGSLDNRARFPLAVLTRIKVQVGLQYPVIYRLSAEEFVQDGLTLEETKVFAGMLVARGVDAIHVSGGVYESGAMALQPADIPQGIYIEHASAIRKEINAAVPVIVVGRIKEPDMAAKIVAEEKADMVAMGRALLADEDLPVKIYEGRTSEIRRCIACNQGCIDMYNLGEAITCLGNAKVGRESEFDLGRTAPVRKRVLVIGGGPAGLEAARVAALRGHDVTLYEREAALGGQMQIASQPPYKCEINELRGFLINQVHALGVKIILNTKNGAGLLDACRPDAVILATGSNPLIPAIKGLENKGVTARAILSGSAAAVGNVVVIGGGMVGCETADYLSERGFPVRVIDMLEEIGRDIGLIQRTLLLLRLHQKGVQIVTSTRVLEITKDAIILEKSGKVEEMKNVDTVIVAVGSTPEDSLQEVLRVKKIPFFKIGDCAVPRKMIDAVHDGFFCAYRL